MENIEKSYVLRISVKLIRLQTGEREPHSKKVYPSMWFALMQRYLVSAMWMIPQLFVPLLLPVTGQMERSKTNLSDNYLYLENIM